MIQTTADLEAACRELARSSYITIDTEFLRETTFWPVLCLIQMASPEMAVIVDPMAPGIDLAPFFALMSNPDVVKVFHAARQDIEIIHHLGNLIPHPIFDTRWPRWFAASVTACPMTSSSTAQERADRQVVPLHRLSRRPLTDKQLDYALADVTHLRDIYQYLTKELDREGRSSWLAEEMAILESRETYDLHPDNAWQRLKMRVKKPIELAVLQKVAAWREREARARNVPRGRIIKDDAIYEIAQQQPKDAEALGRLRTIPKGWERSSAGTALIEAVGEALAIPRGELPRLPRQNHAPEGAAAASELLKVLLKLISEKEGVAAKIIANSDDLDRIAAEGEGADVAALKGWRRELFGMTALKLINGEVALRFVDKKVEAMEIDG